MRNLTFEKLLEEGSLFIPNPLYAINIYYSTAATEDKSYWTDRTWKERLLSWPWRPWIKQKYVSNHVPCMYRTGNSVIAHPAFKEQLEAIRK